LLTLTHCLLPSSLHRIPLSLDHSPYKNNYNRLHCIALPCLALSFIHSFIHSSEKKKKKKKRELNLQYYSLTAPTIAPHLDPEPIAITHDRLA
jgi:hypothetical protein